MLHPFEIHGLGQSPFIYAGFEVLTTKEGQPAGSCDYCSTGIKYACIIESKDGKRFKVGCDCVRKLGNSTNTILTPMERDLKKFKHEEKLREQREKWEVERKESIARREAEELRQRQVNGGLTDFEIEEKKEKERKDALKKHYSEVNEWILAVLCESNGDFVSSMYSQLQESSIKKLSPRCLSILASIYAKYFGRTGSKKYNEAYDNFYDKIDNYNE